MTDKMREAATQALEALEKHCTAFLHHEEAYVNAIIALRTALMSVPDGSEQPAAQEPAVLHQFHKRGCADWYDGLPDHEDGGGPYETRTLYTAPPPAQQCNCVKREPLTNADLKRVINAATMPSNPDDVGRWVVNVCRAIERAHGIGGGV